MNYPSQNPNCPMPNHNDGKGNPRKHPRYPQYKRWANALRAQLVEADTFWDWLRRNYPEEMEDPI